MPRQQGEWQRYAAPTAFLAVATIGIVLVASALHGSPAQVTPPPPTSAPTTTTAATTTLAKTTTLAGVHRSYTVVAGDTFGVIASKTGTTVAQLEQLNPGVSSTSLHIGEKLRVA